MQYIAPYAGCAMGEEWMENGKDVLIVLGCAVRGERVSLTLKLRLDAALEYLEHSPNTAVIVSGGKGDGENISEAEAMKRYLVSHGVDEGRIITEDKSTSTWENFKFSKEILDERFPGASAAFVTTNFHVYRAGRVAIMNGIEAEGYEIVRCKIISVHSQKVFSYVIYVFRTWIIYNFVIKKHWHVNIHFTSFL